MGLQYECSGFFVLKIGNKNFGIHLKTDPWWQWKICNLFRHERIAFHASSGFSSASSASFCSLYILLLNLRISLLDSYHFWYSSFSSSRIFFFTFYVFFLVPDIIHLNSYHSSSLHANTIRHIFLISVDFIFIFHSSFFPITRTLCTLLSLSVY